MPEGLQLSVQARCGLLFFQVPESLQLTLTGTGIGVCRTKSRRRKACSDNFLVAKVVQESLPRHQLPWFFRRISFTLRCHWRRHSGNLLFHLPPLPLETSLWRLPVPFVSFATGDVTVATSCRIPKGRSSKPGSVLLLRVRPSQRVPSLALAWRRLQAFFIGFFVPTEVVLDVLKDACRVVSLVWFDNHSLCGSGIG